MRYKDSVEDHVHELLSARLEGIYALFGQLPDVLEDVWINVALGHMDTSLPSGEIVDVIVLLPASLRSHAGQPWKSWQKHQGSVCSR